MEQNQTPFVDLFNEVLLTSQRFHREAVKLASLLQDDLSEGEEAAKVAASRAPEVIMAGKVFGGTPLYVEDHLIEKVANLYRKHFPLTEVVTGHPNHKGEEQLAVWICWNPNIDMIDFCFRNL